MLRDIRDLTDQHVAYADELRRRWGGLLLSALGISLQGISSHVMFLARGKVGPFRVEAEPITGADGRCAARVVLHDEGNEDKAITGGSYVFTTGR